MRLAKSLGAKTLAIVNAMGSSIAREADMLIYTHAGPEIARGIHQGVYGARSL